MFRFTIRDVLWLMVVVALACGWWLNVKSIHLAQEKRDKEIYDRSMEMLNQAKAQDKEIRKRIAEIQTNRN